MKQFIVDPTHEQEIEFVDVPDFIECCNEGRYAILGIEVGVFNGDKLPISILDNSKAKGETFEKYMTNCNDIAKKFILHHQHYVNHTFIFALMTERRYLEHKAMGWDRT